MSRANVPRWQLICGALVIRPDRCSTQLVRSLGTGRVAAVTAWSSTLLGPEGTGRPAWGWVVVSSRAVPISYRPVIDRGLAGWCGAGVWSFVENCTVDASINCSRQVNKGTRWMPWHQEPKKDVGACDKPREVGNQTLIRGFPNRET